MEVEYKRSKKTKETKDTRESTVFWIEQIDASRRYLKNYRTRANRVYDRYEQDEDMTELSRRAKETYMPRSNILWANTKIEAPTLYSRVPKPVCTVKWDHSNPVTNRASDLLEQNVGYEVEEGDSFDTTMRETVQDVQLTGRGIARVTYDFDLEVVDEQIEVFQDPNQGLIVYGDGTPVEPDKQILQDEMSQRFFIIEQVEKAVNERLDFEHIHFDHFNHTIAKSWKKVNWISFDNYLTRDEVKERFGPKIAERLTYSARAEYDTHDDYSNHEDRIEETEATNKTLVIEIWDKQSQKVRFLAPCYKEEFLEVTDPPFNVTGFFPCPRPFYANKTNRSLIGRPDFVYYESHVNELDYLCYKRYILLSALKIAGVYDQANSNLKKIITSNNNVMIPVNWPAHVEKGGLRGCFELLDFKEVVKQIQDLTAAEQSILQRIYEISGMSDIVRGSTNPNETATAQQIKGQFATLRLAEKQKEVQRFARDLVALAGEIIAENVSDERIIAVAPAKNPQEQQQQLDMEALALLRDDGVRRIKIDIETDSTIAIDEQLEKQQFTEYVAALGPFLQQAMQFMTGAPSFGPFFGELLLRGARVFRFGRSLEGALEQGISGVLEQMQQPKEDGDAKVEADKLQQQYNLKMTELSQKYDLALKKMRQDLEKYVLDATIKAEEIRQEFQLESEKMARADIDKTTELIKQNAAFKQQRMQNDRQKVGSSNR